MNTKDLVQLVKNLQKEIKKLNDKYDTLQDKYDTLQEKYDTLQEKYDTLQEKYDTLQENYDMLEENYSDLKKELTDVRGELAKIQARDLYSAYCQLFCKRLGGNYEADIERSPGQFQRQILDMTSVKHVDRLIAYVQEKLATADADMKQKYDAFAVELNSDPLNVAKYCSKLGKEKILSAKAHPLLKFLTDKASRTAQAKENALHAIQQLTPTSREKAKVILDYIIVADEEITSNIVPVPPGGPSSGPRTPSGPRTSSAQRPRPYPAIRSNARSGKPSAWEIKKR